MSMKSLDKSLMINVIYNSNILQNFIILYR